MVPIVAAVVPAVPGVRHVAKHVTALIMVHVIPRVANASVSVGGLGPSVIRLVQVVFMAVDVNTSKSPTSNVCWMVQFGI